jgi:uncharacterized protein YodC (DUF2158 family)
LGNLQAKLPSPSANTGGNMSNEDDIKIGDTVRRRAGGPTMTVVNVEEEDSGQLMIYCVWFDEKNSEQQGQYPARALVLL